MRWKVIVYFETGHHFFLKEGDVYNRSEFDFRVYEPIRYPSTNPNPAGKPAGIRTVGMAWHWLVEMWKGGSL